MSPHLQSFKEWGSKEEDTAAGHSIILFRENAVAKKKVQICLTTLKKVYSNSFKYHKEQTAIDRTTPKK